jgi:hypothetical protein
MIALPEGRNSTFFDAKKKPRQAKLLPGWVLWGVERIAYTNVL